MDVEQDIFETADEIAHAHTMAVSKSVRSSARIGLRKAIAAALQAERDKADKLQNILDHRPAINAGLPETYIKWSQGIYVVEAKDALGLTNG